MRFFSLFGWLIVAALVSSCAGRISQSPALETPATRPAQARPWDAQDYQIALQLEEEVGHLHGVVKIQLEITRRTKHLVLDAEGMEIQEVRSGYPIYSWDYDGHSLGIELESILDPGAKTWLEVSYSSIPTAGFFFETPGVIGTKQVPHVYTQGECDDARRWFPCNDTPLDRATHGIAVVIPASWESVAAGVKTGERLLPGGRKVVQWQLKYPVPPYLFTFVAGEFSILKNSVSGIDLSFLYEAKDKAAAEATFSRTGEILQFLSNYTEFPYPFAKYSQAIVRGFPFGAMENVTATTAGQSMLSANQISRPTWPTVAHEAAHQWFGDMITCASWPHIWLNEGFATYFTLLYRRHAEGEDDFLWHMGSTVDSYLASCSGKNRRALVKEEYRAPMDLFFDGTVYPGGASRLQLLRGWVGEPMFRAAIARYLRNHAWTSVSSEALQRSFEREGASDMGVFFRQWVFGVGYPELDLSWHVEGSRLKIQVEQTHKAVNPGGNPLSLAAVPWAFKFPLDLRWHSPSQGWVDHRVWVTRRSQSFEIEFSGSIDALVFDPEVFLPAKLTVSESVEATRRRLLKGTNPRDRKLALRRLLEIKELPKLELLNEILEDSSVHPKLRAEILQAAPSLAKRPASLGPELDSFAQAQIRSVLKQPEHPEFASLEEDLLDSPSALPKMRALAIRTAGVRLNSQELPIFLRPWLLDNTLRSPERRAALAVLVARFPDSRTLALVANLASRGRPGAVRADAVTHLSAFVEEFPAARLVLAKAMMAPEVPLRRAAVGVATQFPALFSRALAGRLLVEPNSGIRRQLEQGFSELD